MRERAALVRDVDHVEAGHALEQFAGKMRCTARAARCERQLAGMRLAVGDQLLDRLRRDRRRHHQHQRHHMRQCHRLEALDGVVRQLAHHAGIDGMAARHQRQRVTVRGGLCHQVGADDAGGAAAVVDHHRLAPGFGQLLADQARGKVDGAAGGSGHDDGDGLGGIALGAGAGGGEGNAERCRGECGGECSSDTGGTGLGVHGVSCLIVHESRTEIQRLA
ncbi:hypothetical protein D9M72_359560 [compost metagenome]